MKFEVPVTDVLHCCKCDLTASDAASDAVNELADPVTVPVSELVDISHQLHQQLINLVVSQFSAF